MTAVKILAADAALGIDPLAEPGVVTVAGDWHGESDFVEAVVRAAPAGRGGRPVLLQLGDFGIWPGTPGTQFLDRVEAVLHERDAIVLFVDGNHEDHPQLLAGPVRADGLRVVRPRIYHLPRGFRWTWHGLNWLALGGAHSIDRARRVAGANWWPEQEALTVVHAGSAAAAGPVDVLVSHDCPAGVSIPGIRGPAPGQSQELYRELVIESMHRLLLRSVAEWTQPDRVLHGHYHKRHDGAITLDSGKVCRTTCMARAGLAVAENAMAVDVTSTALTPFGQLAGNDAGNDIAD
jgi:hypothetical protein